MRIDLNADVGESFGAYTIGDDAGVLRSVTSASIAAGFHAGDPSVLRQTVRLARECGVAVGAHPGFPDRAGFGRNEMRLPPAQVEDLVLYQVAVVAGIARSEGLALQHVKPHGALYNMAARERELAEAVVHGIVACDSGLILYAPARSVLAAAGRSAGLRVMAEGFADRGYRPDGSLVPRHLPGALVGGVEQVVQRAIRMVTERVVEAVDGTLVSVDVDTICVHGDSPGAPALAAWLRAGLSASGIDVRSPAGSH